jgi:hypothetical protein
VEANNRVMNGLLGGRATEGLLAAFHEARRDGTRCKIGSPPDYDWGRQAPVLRRWPAYQAKTTGAVWGRSDDRSLLAGA